jgi:predicted RNA-binding protein associated with RNAse of E/G family
VAITQPKDSRKMVDIDDISVLRKKFQKGEITKDDFKKALKYMKQLLEENEHLVNELKKKLKELEATESRKNKKGGEPA